MALKEAQPSFYFASEAAALSSDSVPSLNHFRNLTTSNSKSEPSSPSPSNSTEPNNSLLRAVKDRFSLDEFLNDRCKSGDINHSDALCLFDCMLNKWSSPPPMSSFNILFGGLAKSKQYDTAVSLFKRLNSVGLLLPNFLSYCILINCFSKIGRVLDGFIVFGRMLRGSFTPNVVVFTSLIKGLCAESRIMEAAAVFTKLKAFGCEPNVITCTTLINGLCRIGHTIIALNLFEAMADGNGEFGVEGFVDKAMEMFLQMKDENINPNVVTYTSLIHGFCHVDDWNEAKRLFIEMMDQGVQPNVVSFNVVIDDLCKNGKMNEASWLVELMIQRGVHPDAFTYSTLMDGFCLTGRINRAKVLFVSMESMGCKHYGFSYGILINGYCKNNNVVEAISLIQRNAL
ncbi:hypothetical protein CUMW_208750 [Citrus unshiu]|uniref:Pentacotripeptide-repeat region of PRORP domain-containing protein n=1 Tax=Citrus unshiu TaxID=55188 RepID=A0A2H5Q9G9_CITUN|nr:hypothetical protein CUMW_208750 [Citrus unshiu]